MRAEIIRKKMQKTVLKQGVQITQSSMIATALGIVFWLGVTVILTGRLRPRWMNRLLVFEGMVALLAGALMPDNAPVQAKLLFFGIGITAIILAIIRKRKKSLHITKYIPPLRLLGKLNDPWRMAYVIVITVIVMVGMSPVIMSMQSPDTSNSCFASEAERAQRAGDCTAFCHVYEGQLTFEERMVSDCWNRCYYKDTSCDY